MNHHIYKISVYCMQTVMPDVIANYWNNTSCLHLISRQLYFIVEDAFTLIKKLIAYVLYVCYMLTETG